MMVSKRNLLFQGLPFRFHVKFQGCTVKVEGDQAKIVIRPLSPLARALEEADIQSEEDESAVELGT